MKNSWASLRRTGIQQSCAENSTLRRTPRTRTRARTVGLKRRFLQNHPKSASVQRCTGAAGAQNKTKVRHTNLTPICVICALERCSGACSRPREARNGRRSAARRARHAASVSGAERLHTISAQQQLFAHSVLYRGGCARARAWKTANQASDRHRLACCALWCCKIFVCQRLEGRLVCSQKKD